MGSVPILADRNIAENSSFAVGRWIASYLGRLSTLSILAAWNTRGRNRAEPTRFRSPVAFPNTV
jgi:hypothetical protein